MKPAANRASIVAAAGLAMLLAGLRRYDARRVHRVPPHLINNAAYGATARRHRFKKSYPLQCKKSAALMVLPGAPRRTIPECGRDNFAAAHTFALGTSGTC